MILCPNDHAAATEGALNQQEQRTYKNKPHNIVQGYELVCSRATRHLQPYLWAQTNSSVMDVSLRLMEKKY